MNAEASIIQSFVADNTRLDEATVERITTQPVQCSELTDDILIEVIQLMNHGYRAGQPLISDHDYDHVLLAELRRRLPEHPFLNQIEPEPAFSAKTVALPERMLSTEKAYSLEEMQRWLKRLEKAATELGIDGFDIRITPKLDGFAAYDDGQKLYTRGDGFQGSNISRVFERGLAVGGNGERGQGPGEIVVNQTYFDQHLSTYFNNSRNFQAAVLAEKKEDPIVMKSIQDQAVVFMPFQQLPSWDRAGDQLFEDFDRCIETAWQSVPYEVDGVIFEIKNTEMKNHMGATLHHHRWQIAYKVNTEKARVMVVGIHPQTSRSGRVNPVVEVEPTPLSGVTIRHVTAHHYNMVKKHNIGPGTEIELVRSGMVIPKIEAVLKSTQAQLPEHCPSCESELIWQSDFLFCSNTQNCPAQAEKSIEHFFATLGNIDGFGGKTISKLCELGVNDVASIYQLDHQTLTEMGFGDKTAENLLAELQRSRLQPLQDWRFLAAFGVPRLGAGNSERLLGHYPLSELFELEAVTIAAIEGFAEKTADELVKGLALIQSSFATIYAFGFNLIITPLQDEVVETQSVISGKTLVFTGKMLQPRGDMEEQAKQLGAKIASSVSAKTDYLVTGENVGSKKIADAEKKSVQVITESDYLALIAEDV